MRSSETPGRKKITENLKISRDAKLSTLSAKTVWVPSGSKFSLNLDQRLTRQISYIL